MPALWNYGLFDPVLRRSSPACVAPICVINTGVQAGATGDPQRTNRFNGLMNPVYNLPSS
jgi:hypothetical protein